MGKITTQGLRKFNVIMVPIFTLQALAIWFWATDFKLPVTISYLTYNGLTQSLIPVSKTLFELPLAWLIIAFLLMSMLAHLIISTVWYPRYKKDLARGMNRARWIEYSFSASTMIVAIAMLVGNFTSVICAGIGNESLRASDGNPQPDHSKNQMGGIYCWLYCRNCALDSYRVIVLVERKIWQRPNTSLCILDICKYICFL
jgi:hypothetical protein